MKNTPSDLHALINCACNPNWEPAFDTYSVHLKEINRLVEESGVPIEGNLFTDHLQLALPEMPIEKYRNKRINYAVFCNAGDSLLEIGFNAGHSCLLALSENPDLTYVGVDIGMHPYTIPCYNYLKRVFGNRIRLHIGDSRDVLPMLRRQNQRFDLYHLDGGHGFNIACADMCNLLDFAAPGAPLLVDDTFDHLIDGLCDFYVLQGQIAPIHLNRLWQETIDHRVFRVTTNHKTRFA